LFLMKTTILFDLDGTLVDTIELIMQSMEFAFSDFEGPRPTRDQWLLGLGITLRTQLAQWSRTSTEHDWLIARYRIYQGEHQDRMTVAYPGVADVLTELSARGHPMAIVTSKYHALASKVLRHVKFDAHFGAVVGGDSIANPKPHPEPVLKALADLKHARGRAVFVGDSPHDVRAGNSAGIETAAALWGPFTRDHLTEAAPTHWLSTINDLPAIVA
jgi:pyrophosphatase PpaX